MTWSGKFDHGYKMQSNAGRPPSSPEQELTTSWSLYGRLSPSMDLKHLIANRQFHEDQKMGRTNGKEVIEWSDEDGHIEEHLLDLVWDEKTKSWLAVTPNRILRLNPKGKRGDGKKENERT